MTETGDTLAALAARLESMERQVRRLRLALTAVLAGGGLLLLSAQAPGAARDLVVSRLIVDDAATGQQLVIGRPAVAAVAAEGDPTAEPTACPPTFGLTVYEDGRPRVAAGIDAFGAATLAVSNELQESGAIVSHAAGGVAMTLAVDDQPRLVATVDDAAGGVTLFDAAALVLAEWPVLDAEG